MRMRVRRNSSTTELSSELGVNLKKMLRVLPLVLFLALSCAKKVEKTQEDQKVPEGPSEEEKLREVLRKDFEDFLMKARHIQGKH